MAQRWVRVQGLPGAPDARRPLGGLETLSLKTKRAMETKLPMEYKICQDQFSTVLKTTAKITVYILNFEPVVIVMCANMPDKEKVSLDSETTHSSVRCSVLRNAGYVLRPTATWMA